MALPEAQQYWTHVTWQFSYSWQIRNNIRKQQGPEVKGLTQAVHVVVDKMTEVSNSLWVTNSPHVIRNTFCHSCIYLRSNQHEEAYWSILHREKQNVKSQYLMLEVTTLGLAEGAPDLMAP